MRMRDEHALVTAHVNAYVHVYACVHVCVHTNEQSRCALYVNPAIYSSSAGSAHNKSRSGPVRGTSTKRSIRLISSICQSRQSIKTHDHAGNQLHCMQHRGEGCSALIQFQFNSFNAIQLNSCHSQCACVSLPFVSVVTIHHAQLKKHHQLSLRVVVLQMQYQLQQISQDCILIHLHIASLNQTASLASR